MIPLYKLTESAEYEHEPTWTSRAFPQSQENILTFYRTTRKQTQKFHNYSHLFYFFNHRLNKREFMAVAIRTLTHKRPMCAAQALTR